MVYPLRIDIVVEYMENNKYIPPGSHERYRTPKPLLVRTSQPLKLGKPQPFHLLLEYCLSSTIDVPKISTTRVISLAKGAVYSSYSAQDF